MSRKTKTAKGNFDAMLMKPKIDFAFKMLFSGAGEKSALLLTDLLNAIMGLEGDEKITQIEHLNPYIGREYESDKASIMDVKVKTQAGELIDIEMQVGSDDDYRKRTLYYWAKMYAEAATKGRPYSDLKKCVVINIMDFNLLDETTNYHSIFVIKEAKKGFMLNSDLELHYIELPKFAEKEHISNMNNLEKWLTFIKYAGEEGKDSLIEKIKQESEVIEMASVILKTMSEDERIRQEYYQREKWAMDKASQAAYIKAREEAAAKAEEKAAKAEEKAAKAEEKAAKAEEKAAEMREKLIKTAINLIQRGYTIEEIADIIGLPAEEIKKLQEN